MQRAGAGLRSIAEPVVDTTSDFAELVLAMLGVAAKLERRRILERTARGRADGKGEGRQTRPQAETHRASTARGAAADRRRRDTAQRRAQLQCQSGDDFTARGLTHHPVAPSSLLAERRAAAVIGATANAAAPAEPAQSVLDRAPLIIRDQPDQQEIVLVLNDFSFTAPEEIFANLKNGSNMPGMAEGRRKGSGGGAKPMPASMKDK